MKIGLLKRIVYFYYSANTIHDLGIILIKGNLKRYLIHFRHSGILIG